MIMHTIMTWEVLRKVRNINVQFLEVVKSILTLEEEKQVVLQIRKVRSFFFQHYYWYVVSFNHIVL